jgi:hypothetical protein
MSQIPHRFAGPCPNAPQATARHPSHNALSMCAFEFSIATNGDNAKFVCRARHAVPLLSPTGREPRIAIETRLHAGADRSLRHLKSTHAKSATKSHICNHCVQRRVK